MRPQKGGRELLLREAGKIQDQEWELVNCEKFLMVKIVHGLLRIEIVHIICLILGRFLC